VIETRTADAIVVGWGLAGLVAATELLEAGKSVLLIDQESEANLGGQAWWSFGGLFLIDSPEQRRMGIKDSIDLARQDWFGSAGFDRDDEDFWGKQWAEAYLQFAHTEKRAWLHAKGHRIFPVVGWAERGGGLASGHGNSVPRFHITWGTGPGIVEPFERAVRAGIDAGRLTLLPRHRVDALIVEDGAVVGACGNVLAQDAAARGQATNRDVIGEFEVRAASTLIATGGIGGNHDLVREAWPARLGTPPQHMLSGVPAHVDGRGIGIAAEAGARLVNGDRMWHYVEGIQNWDPVWAKHGIRILPGPSSLWLDATGKRLPTPLFPGFDTLATLDYLRSTGHDHSWFILDQAIIEKEFALSGSEQNPDLTNKSIRELLRQRLGKGATEPVEAFKRNGADFVVADDLDALFRGIAELDTDGVFDADRARAELEARDREFDNDFTKDAQVQAIRVARNYRGDKLIRVAGPHRIQDPKAGPLIAVKLHVLTRKSLGGIQTNLDSQALDASGAPIQGLYAAGEAAGFGGGGVHGYRSLEGTFLGGCLFSGRAAGRAMAKQA